MCNTINVDIQRAIGPEWSAKSTKREQPWTCVYCIYTLFDELTSFYVLVICSPAENLWCQHSSALRWLVRTSRCHHLQDCFGSGTSTEFTARRRDWWRAANRTSGAFQFSMARLVVPWHCANRSYVLRVAERILQYGTSTARCIDRKNSDRGNHLFRSLVLVNSDYWGLSPTIEESFFFDGQLAACQCMYIATHEPFNIAKELEFQSMSSTL